VVKETGLFSGHLLSPGSLLVADEFIVPKDAVETASRERIDLKASGAEVRSLQPYITYREKGESVGEELEDVAVWLGSGPEVRTGSSRSPTSLRTSWRSTAERT